MIALLKYNRFENVAMLDVMPRRQDFEHTDLMEGERHQDDFILQSARPLTHLMFRSYVRVRSARLLRVEIAGERKR
jgi:hypothetical protein